MKQIRVRRLGQHMQENMMKVNENEQALQGHLIDKLIGRMDKKLQMSQKQESLSKQYKADKTEQQDELFERHNQNLLSIHSADDLQKSQVITRMNERLAYSQNLREQQVKLKCNQMHELQQLKQEDLQFNRSIQRSYASEQVEQIQSFRKLRSNDIKQRTEQFQKRIRITQ